MEPTLDHCRRNFKTVVPLPAINQVQTLCKVGAVHPQPVHLCTFRLSGWRADAYKAGARCPPFCQTVRRHSSSAHGRPLPPPQILEGILPKEVPRGAPPPDKKLLEHHFVFACIWAFGGCLLADKVTDHRLQFSRWWQSEHKAVPFPPEVRPCVAGGKGTSVRRQRQWFAVALPALTLVFPFLPQGTVFDYYVDDQNVCMAHWSQRVPQFTYIPGASDWACPRI